MKRDFFFNNIFRIKILMTNLTQYPSSPQSCADENVHIFLEIECIHLPIWWPFRPSFPLLVVHLLQSVLMNHPDHHIHWVMWCAWPWWPSPLRWRPMFWWTSLSGRGDRYFFCHLHWETFLGFHNLSSKDLYVSFITSNGTGTLLH